MNSGHQWMFFVVRKSCFPYPSVSKLRAEIEKSAIFFSLVYVHLLEQYLSLDNKTSHVLCHSHFGETTFYVLHQKILLKIEIKKQKQKYGTP